MKKKAVAYVRVSTDKKEQELSLENQEKFFEKYIRDKGDELVAIYSDKGKSATKMQNRPELQKMLRQAKRKEFQKIYVKDISRIFRNMKDFIDFSRDIIDGHGIEIHLVNMGDGRNLDKFLMGIFAMFAEYESQKISERVKFGKNVSKEKGIVPNFVFGYDRPDKYTLIPNEEAEWVKKVFDMYTEEGIGMGKIATYLYEKRVPTSKKKDGEVNINWSQNAIKRMLENEKYIGLVINNKQQTKNLYSGERVDLPESEWIIAERPEFRIVSNEQFEKAKKLMETNKRKFPVDPETGKRILTRRSEAHALSNLLKCSVCGGSYRRYQRKHSDKGKHYYWWVCSNRDAYGRDKCTAEHIRLEEADVLSALSMLFDYLVQDRVEFFKMVESACNHLIKEHIRQSSSVDLEKLEAELNELQEERERIKTMMRKGLLEINEGEADMRELNAGINNISAIIYEKDVTDDLTRKVKENLREFFKAFDEFSYAEGFTGAGLKSLVSKIEVKSKTDLNAYFNVDDAVEDLIFPVKIEGAPPVKKIDTESNDST